MSMSTHVYGFQPCDEEWQLRLRAYDALRAARLTIPSELSDFFGNEDPHKLPGREIEIKQACREFATEMQNIIEVDLSKLPPTVKFLRFVNAY